MRDKSQFDAGKFSEAFKQILPEETLERVVQTCGPLKRCPPKLPHAVLIEGLVFHAMRGNGNFAASVRELTRENISDSALSQRRGNLPWQLFATLMDEALSAKADPQKHPAAFFKGRRLMGVDGSQFSVANTPQNNETFIKAASRRMKAAFGKLGVSVLVELGLHNPVAARVGGSGMSEQELSQPLLKKLPSGSLLLADRAYGLGCWVKRIRDEHPKGDRDFLFRVRSSCKTKGLEVFPDGSAWVEIEVKGEKIQLREIIGRVRRPGGKWSTIRLWTSLKDWREFPAMELLALYGRRWEQESFYKELKVDMRSATLLNSHTEVTAAQEIAALILAQAIVVEQRIAIAQEGGVEVLRISFQKTYYRLQALWEVIAAGAGILSRQQIRELTQEVMRRIARWAIPPRRKRSCPRKVRQPIGSWPRLTKNSYQVGETETEITPIAL
ncbi:MAG TPA: IS4 family transposase [Candidatus Saccharimonadales bacterium]|nr:IS4 family transposase [Candidatus Saccharimonadales bacterium]